MKAPLDGKTVTLKAKAGTGGRLFGSVTTKDVANKISDELNIEVDKRKINMQDIKAFGTVKAEVKVYNGVVAQISVQVIEA